MIKCGVCKNENKSEITESCRITQYKWVFKVKTNGRHGAQLCTISYIQVAGVDFQDNFAPVVNDVVFWIGIVLMMIYS